MVGLKRHPPHRWTRSILPIVSVLLFAAAGFLQAGVAFRSPVYGTASAAAGTATAPVKPVAPTPSAHLKTSWQACTGANWAVCDLYAPVSANCEFVSIVTVGIFGPGCGYTEG